MAAWSCTACHVNNPAHARACEGCGEDRATRHAPAAASASAGQCAWMDHGRQCRLPGTIGEKASRCTWHATIAPRYHDDYAEFEAWCRAMRAGKYCCVWTHYPVGTLWHWLHGHDAQIAPHACAVGRCPHAPELAVDPRSGVEQARAFRAHLARLLRTPLVDAPRRARPPVVPVPGAVEDVR